MQSIEPGLFVVPSRMHDGRKGERFESLGDAQLAAEAHARAGKSVAIWSLSGAGWFKVLVVSPGRKAGSVQYKTGDGRDAARLATVSTKEPELPDGPVRTWAGGQIRRVGADDDD